MDDRWFRLGDHGRYPDLPMRRSISIRDTLICTALIAMCVACWINPEHLNVQYKEMIREFGFVGANLLFLYILFQFMRIPAKAQWAIAVLVPSIVIVLWHFVFADNLVPDRAEKVAVGPIEVFLMYAFEFAIGFLLVISLVPRLLSSKPNEVTDRTEIHASIR